MSSVHTKGKRFLRRIAVGLFSMIFTILAMPACAYPETRDVAVFMYHDFVRDGEESPWAVTESVFESHVKSLAEAGYTGVDFADLQDFVMGEGELPEKCVVLSCDDGYSGVIDIALPICEKYGMKLTCALIGNAVENENHFFPDPALAERIELTSHSYAIHDLPDGYRMPQVEDEEYRQMILSDTIWMTDAFDKIAYLLSRGEKRAVVIPVFGQDQNAVFFRQIQKIGVKHSVVFIKRILRKAWVCAGVNDYAGNT